MAVFPNNPSRITQLVLFLFQDNQFLHTTLEEINASLVVYQKLSDLKLLSLDTAISNITRRVALLENYVVAVNKLENRENLSTSAVSAQ